MIFNKQLQDIPQIIPLNNSINKRSSTSEVNQHRTEISIRNKSILELNQLQEYIDIRIGLVRNRNSIDQG